MSQDLARNRVIHIIVQLLEGAELIGDLTTDILHMGFAQLLADFIEDKTHNQYADIACLNDFFQHRLDLLASDVDALDTIQPTAAEELEGLQKLRHLSTFIHGNDPVQMQKM